MPSDAALSVTARPSATPAVTALQKSAGQDEATPFATLVDTGDTLSFSDALAPSDTANAASPQGTSTPDTKPMAVLPAIKPASVPSTGTAQIMPVTQDASADATVPAETATHDPVNLLPIHFETDEAPSSEPATEGDAVALAPEMVPAPDSPTLVQPATPGLAIVTTTIQQEQAPASDSDAGKLTAKPVNGRGRAEGSTRSLAAGKAEQDAGGSDQALASPPSQSEGASKSGSRAARATPTMPHTPTDETKPDASTRATVQQASFADIQIPVADATLRGVYQAQQNAGAALSAATTVIQGHSGQIGRDMGALIKRQIVDGKEEVTVRLDPPELGRIHIRLSFESAGELRAVVATETSAALDLLRRDVNQLDRALTDAGVRTDGQSFRFDERQTGQGFARSGDQNNGRDTPRQGKLAEPEPTLPARSNWRGISASGRVDMIA